MNQLVTKNNKKNQQSSFKQKGEKIVVVTKFDFKKDWHFVKPYLSDPEVLESLDEGMLSFSRDYGWSHLPLWDRKNRIGPWEYTKFDSHHSYACDQANEDSDYYRLDEKYTKIFKEMGVNLVELDMHPLDFQFEKDNPKFKKVAESYLEEFYKIEKKYLPKENTYKWYQCFGACFYLADWQETLATKVYPKYEWHTYQKRKKGKTNGRHSTTIGRKQKGDLLIFDILLFESTSIEEILEAAGVDLTKLH